jgi:hypothetical protein
MLIGLAMGRSSDKGRGIALAVEVCPLICLGSGKVFKDQQLSASAEYFDRSIVFAVPVASSRYLPIPNS